MSNLPSKTMRSLDNSTFTQLCATDAFGQEKQENILGIPISYFGANRTRKRNGIVANLNRPAPFHSFRQEGAQIDILPFEPWS